MINILQYLYENCVIYSAFVFSSERSESLRSLSVYSTSFFFFFPYFCCVIHILLFIAPELPILS